MLYHASYASNISSGLILFLGICVISCKCVNHGRAPPKPMPKPKPAEIEPETTLKQQGFPNPPKHPHKLTPPPLPSGSFDSYDSDQHKYNITSSGVERNKYGVNPYGVQRSNEFKLGIQYWADDEVMLMFPKYPPLRSFEKHYGRYGGLDARRFWAHWDIPDDRSANGFHSGFNSDNVMGGRPPPINSHDFEYRPGRYPKRYYMRSHENPKKKKRQRRAVAQLKNKLNEEGFEYDLDMVNPYNMGGRPPPGKTERRKKKTNFELANTVPIRNKRGVTAQMNPDVEAKIQRVKRELDSEGYEETLNKLKKRNKKDLRGNKRHAFKSWMSKVVPEHAAHIEKLHDKGIDKLMEQKVHGMKKTYGELFHEHHEKTQQENKEPRHPDMHGEHHLEMHGEHEHEPLHEGHEPHHVNIKNEHHKEQHEGLQEPHHFEIHAGHDEPHHLEEHAEHNPHHEVHAKEHDSHHLIDKEKFAEEHKLEARKRLLEEMYLKEGKKSHEVKDKHELEETEHEETPQQTAAAPVQQAQQQNYQQQLYQQQQQQNQMYNQQQGGQYNNYNQYGGGGGGMGGMGMNGMGGMGAMGMGGMGGMGMNGMGGMGMNGMGGMGMNGMGMGMGQMGGFGAILNAVNNNLPKLSQTQAPQGQGGNYPGGGNTGQNYGGPGGPGGQNPNYGGQNYPQSPAANGQDPNVQAAQDAAAAQQKAAQDQEAQLQQPDAQDSTAVQDNKDQDTSADSSINAKAGDGSDDDIKADNSNGNDDLNLPSEDTINGQQDNGIGDEDNLQNLQQGQQFDNGQLGQFAHYDTGVNSANMAAAAGGK